MPPVVNRKCEDTVFVPKCVSYTYIAWTNPLYATVTPHCVVTPCGFAGSNLLAMILFEKFAQHQPLNRQSERYAREGIDLSLSTLADRERPANAFFI